MNEEKYEFASRQWCELAADLGVRMIHDAGLDLDSYAWGFSEEYTHTPDRLMDGRQKAGYFFMITGGKVTGGIDIPPTCTSLAGFHVRLPWASIAHASSFFYGRQGQRQRSRDEAVMWRELKPYRQKPEDEGLLKEAEWPSAIGAALSDNAEQGGGLHNLTAARLRHSAEVCDLPQTSFGVPIVSEMSAQQRQRFIALLG